jgi:hypothetical protein
MAKMCQEKENVMVVTFLYIQNLPVPYIHVQEVFYDRQVWIHEFGMHVMERKKVFFHSYYEGQAVKGSNKVLTFLLDFTEKYAPPTIITELLLFSDSCPG